LCWNHRFRISDVGETLTKYCGTAILLTVFELTAHLSLASLPLSRRVSVKTLKP
jgi:hypothetical protein